MTDERIQQIINELENLKDRFEREQERFQSLHSEVVDAIDENDISIGYIEDLIDELKDELDNDEEECKQEQSIDLVQAMAMYGTNFQLMM